jgi:hypothetical protein
MISYLFSNDREAMLLEISAPPWLPLWFTQNWGIVLPAVLINLVLAIFVWFFVDLVWRLM